MAPSEAAFSMAARACAMLRLLSAVTESWHSATLNCAHRIKLGHEVRSKPRTATEAKPEGIRTGRASPWRAAGSGARGREGSAPPPDGRSWGRRPWRRRGGVGGGRGRRRARGPRRALDPGRGARRLWMWLRLRLSSHGGGAVAA